jgi:hypothetical protein
MIQLIQKMELIMKIADLNNSVKEVSKKSTSKKQPVKLKDMLLIISNEIQRFEKNGQVDSKIDKDKINILKNIVSDMIKNEDQKQIIMGKG